MNNTTDRIERNDDLRAEQLTLLTVPAADAQLRPSAAHARFRLSAATRRRGLEHVAQIRRQLAATHDERTPPTSGALPPRRNVAA